MSRESLTRFRSGSVTVAQRAPARRCSCVGALLWLCAGTAGAEQFDIVGPAASVQFGAIVAVLPNGNIVVVDTEFQGTKGAVYLYSPTGTLLSTVIGNSEGDRVGSGRIVVLSNGNYVILSPEWDGAGAADAGAVTWGSATAGVSGVVTAANSLVGTSENDALDGLAAAALTNGNYVVSFSGWDNGSVVDAGAVVWCNGTTGRIGPVSTSIALYGTAEQDLVGRGRIAVLGNGNYVVPSPNWNNGPDAGVGAVTWGNGASGTTGPVSAANSLVGSTAEDGIGGRITVLTNGNYVVRSTRWDNLGAPDAGAATWGNGNGGTVGAVTALNSLVGSTENDNVGENALALSNGNYVVTSEAWDNGPVENVGAATFSSGSGGTVGPITVSNSLIGDTTLDFVGSNVVPLTNGNYVVVSPLWNGDTEAEVGAVTWGNKTTGISGVVSASNSLVGDTQFDSIGNSAVVALSNGNYVVGSPSWHGPLPADDRIGAATFADGASGLTGVVSPANSLIGSAPLDQVGRQVVALTNGNYVVASDGWENGGVIDAGAVTWGDGTNGTVGVVSVSNSLVGGSEGDQVGRVKPLGNGSYVVGSFLWDLGGDVDVGAATWCSGTGPTSAVVSASNSLIGSSPSDLVGDFFEPGNKDQPVPPPADGAYVVFALEWDDAPNVVSNAGAVALGYGNGDPTGAITPNNSVIGTVVDGGFSMAPAYDAPRGTLVVGRPASNVVTLFNQKVFADGFE